MGCLGSVEFGNFKEDVNFLRSKPISVCLQFSINKTSSINAPEDWKFYRQGPIKARNFP